jgi:FdhD protein
MTQPLGNEPRQPDQQISMIVMEKDGAHPRRDRVVIEEPLEIRVVLPDETRHSISVTMRTPGQDEELAAGFLFTEGILPDRSALGSIEHCPSAIGAAVGNVVNARLAAGAAFDPARVTRNVYTTSSCGICGRASLDLIRQSCPVKPKGSFELAYEWILGLSSRARDSQTVFEGTGGLHAAALFEPNGDLLFLREDVGRHNAVDKIVGALLLDHQLPASNRVLWVSGRASFELVQKAVLAGIPAMTAVGAPSSLAVEAGREFGMTLIGFLRDGRFNVYSGADRIEVI